MYIIGLYWHNLWGHDDIVSGVVFFLVASYVSMWLIFLDEVGFRVLADGSPVSVSIYKKGFLSWMIFTCYV
jgi:hypothetical protein